MAQVSSDYSSNSRSYRDRVKEKYKSHKQDSPRKRYNSEYARNTNDSTSKEYERKYEERIARQSSRHWEDRQVNFRSNDKNRSSSPSSQRYNNHEYLDDHGLRSASRYRSESRVSQHRSSHDVDRYDDPNADDARFKSYNNHEFEDNKRIDYLSRKSDTFTDPELYIQENESLRHRINNASNHDSNSEVTIIFQNKELELRLLPTLEELVYHLTNGKIELEELQAFLNSKRNSLKNDLPEGDLFALDSSTIEPNESASVPCYETSFSEVLQDQDQMTQADNKAKNARPKRAKTCFNCSEDHNMHECPYRIDQRRVAMARKEHQNSFIQSNKRYHVQSMQESDFKPGNISNELREALSLRPDQIPLYIYRMRILNYPPGWLEEAEVETSGITLYDTETQTDENKAKKRNEVQYDPDKLIDFPGFNVPLPPQFTDEADQLCLPLMQDCHLRSYVEQFMPKVENTIPKRKRKLSLSDNKPTKVQRFEEDMDMDESFNNGSLEFNPPLPDENPPPPPPPDDELPPLPDEELPPLPPDDELPPLPQDDESLSSLHKDEADLPSDDILITISSDDSGTNTPMSESLLEALAPVVERFQMTESTPSLKDLEEIKKKLEMELGRSDDSSDCSIPCFSLDNSNDISSNCSFTSEGLMPSRQVSKTESCSGPASRQVSMTESFGEGSSEEQYSSLKLYRTESQKSGSKLVTLGTPSLTRHSSFKSLPKYENFSKDVADHLNFENLPNSTGTYAKMKKVIKKVKEKINSFMP